MAVIVANNVDGDDIGGGTLGESTEVKIPAVSISKADGARLRERPGAATIALNAGVRADRTRNVVAQTKTGATDNVVMAGAHLDSVPKGPGINDNGSGVAAVLETAVQLGSSPDVRNAVRFGFWAAEEEGLVGSGEYVKTLDVEALKDIALYLNFDMLASPNPGYFTYDGDQSAPPTDSVPRVPEGSAGIERLLAAYLEGAGKEPRDTSFDGRSDYDGFTQAGIPAGGLFAGAEDKKTPDEARIWAGRPINRSTRTITRVPTPSTRSTARRSTSRVGASPTPSVFTPRMTAAQRRTRPPRPHPARGDAVVRTALAAASLLLVAGCSSPPPPPPPVPHQDSARELAAKVTVDGMYGHLKRLADIATANGNTRADGTPGFDASVDYVAGALRDKGFDVQTPEFERLAMTSPGRPTLVASGRSFPVDQASLLVTTAPGGLSAVTLRPQRASGCSAGDYGTVDVRGAIAIVDDEGCSVVDKQNAAIGRGAVGLLVVSEPGASGSPAGLFTPGYYQQLTSPVAVIDEAADAQLRRTSAPVRLTLDAKSAVVKSRSVVAQTKTGDPHNVVVVGAHLDSATDSPGLNDDASGVAAVLETAVQLGSSPTVTNAVRFAFWGSQQTGLQGSTKYVAGLGRDGLHDVALYLDFDLLGSTNAGYFTYDGDQSGQPNPDVPAARVPVGSAGLERTLAGYLNLAGVRPADLPLGLSSDYSAFLRAGVPIGGITTDPHSARLQRRRDCGAVGRGWPSTPTIRRRATRSPTSTARHCRSPVPRWPSPSAPTRSRPRAPTASPPGRTGLPG